MNIRVTQGFLSDAITRVLPSVSRRSTLPALKCILLDTSDGRLRLSATDLETYTTTHVSAKVDAPGAICIDASLLAATVKALDDTALTLAVDDKQRLCIDAGQHVANLKGIASDQFPTEPEPNAEDAVTLDAARFRRAIGLTAFAAAGDETRPVLTGVLLSAQGETLTLAAADGYRCSITTIEQPGLPDGEWLVPARALDMVARLDGDALALHSDGGGVRVGFDAGETAITSQLIAGQFPDVRQIVPSTWETRVTIERVTLAQAVKLGLVFAKDAANVLQLTAGPNSLRVAATSTEHGDNTTMLDADVEGAGGEIAFNARYLLDALQAMDSERVVLDMRDANAPGVWRMESDDSFAHVLMPMHVAEQRG